MKRFAFLFLLFSVLLPVTSAHAQTGNYDQALQMVRLGKLGQAMKEFKILAESNHAPSEFSIGLMYHLGRGVDKNLETAYNWYKRSMIDGHPPALNNIGMMYLNGEYVVQHRETAFRLFKKASTTHAQAMDNLAQCYENGWGTDRQIKRATNMYQLAGENGYVLGWYHLGKLYEKGYPDTPRDIEKAVEWYIMAAEKKQKHAIKRLKRLGRLPEGLDQ